MKRLLILTLAVLLIPGTTFSQGKNPRKRRSSTTSQQQSPRGFRDEAVQVATQLKLLTRFLFVYGKISAGLETADEQAKRGESSETLIAQIRQDKANVVSNINNIKAGLENLAQTFQTKPQLQTIYLKLASASEMTVHAAQLASANRFDEAGRALLGAADRLSEVLVELR